MQGFVVAVIVLACSGYAVWALLPSVARRRAAGFALRAPWPGFIEKRLRRTATMASGCACNGCDAPAKAAPKEQAIRIHRRPSR